MWKRLVIALLCAAVGFGFNSNPAGSGGAVAGGNCTGGQFMSGITTAGVPVCSTPSGGAPFPPGNVPQIGGYSALNAGEAETVVGDFTFARTGTNQYTATVAKINGVAVGALATLNVGTGLTSSAGSLNLTTPVAVTNGGTGSGTAPTVGQMMVASSTSAFTPVSMSGDAALTSAGVITVTKTNGVALTGLATAAIPLSIANGGTGSSTAPSVGQIPVASSISTFTPVTLSGDATITSAGVLTVTKSNGTAFGPLATATTPLSVANGGRGSSTALTTGQIDVAQSATAFAAVTMSGDATIASTGAITVTKTNGVAFGAAATLGVGTGLTSSGGNLNLTTPVSIANGGRGASTALTAGQIDVAQSGTAFGAVTMTGDATITSGGLITVTKLNGTTPGGTCTGSQFVNVISSSGVPTCAALPAPAAGSITDAMLANAYSGVGTCTAGSWVSTLNRNGAPTCTAPSSNYAPLTNPAGGQNNYAPTANPTFTGVAATPQLLLTNTATTQLFFGSTTTPGATFSSYGAGTLEVAAGAHISGPGTHTADATAAMIATHESGGSMGFYINTGLTVGSTFTPTEIGYWGATGLVVGTGASLTNLTLPYGIITATDNAGGATLPAAKAVTWTFRDNYYAGPGEMDLLNDQNLTGPGWQGWAFLQNTGGTTYAESAYLDGSGDLRITRAEAIGNPGGGFVAVGALNVANGVYLNAAAYTNPDYVFDRYYGSVINTSARMDDPSYQGLMSLDEVEAYIEKHHELPRIADYKENGEVFHRTDRLLEKMEEMTLYMIDLQKQVNELKRERVAEKGG